MDLQSVIDEGKRIVFFGGAGVSTESGIPDFRSQDGLYNQKYKFPPEQIISHSFFTTNPEEFYRFYRDRMIYPAAKPNAAHLKLAELERAGKLTAVVTQNIDGLHQAAGSKNVQEFHGTIHTLSCPRCLRKYQTEDVNLDEIPPVCFCGTILKPDFVFYGEGINPRVYAASEELAAQADVMLVVGTAGQVMPACSLPLAAKGNGAKIIEVNTLKSVYTDSVSDLYFPMKATEFFTELEKNL